MPPSWMATAVPASTGATEAASVAGRTADHQTLPGVRAGAVATTSGSLRELREVRFPFLHVRVAAFLRLFAHVVEKGRVARQLLDAGQPVIGSVEARFEQGQGRRAELEHAAAPGDRLLLERGEGHDLVDEPHRQRLLRVVLLAKEPDLAGLLLADDAGEEARAVTAIEAPDLRPGLAEAGVVRGDRQVAHDVEHVASTDRIAGHHRDDGFGQPPDLDLQVEDVEPSCARRIDVAVVAADALVAAGAERLGAGPGQDDDADLWIVAGHLEGSGHVEYSRWLERGAELGAVDRDLGEAVPRLVDDVLVLARTHPRAVGPGGST